MDFKNKIKDCLRNIWKADSEYNSILKWIPKTSLAYKDIIYSNMDKIKYNKLQIQTHDMFVEEVSIIKFKLNKREKLV